MGNEQQDLRAKQLHRMLANFVRIGTIEAVDYAAARARVRIGTFMTDWLPWLTGRAGPDRAWVPLEAGEQVAVLSPSGNPELGIIIGSLYQTAHPANGDRGDLRRVTFADGTVCEYDRAAHELNVNIPAAGAKLNVHTASEINLQAGAKISLAAPLIALNGDIVQDSGSGSAGTFTLRSSQITIEGPVVQTGGDFISDGISAQHHTHGGVDPGSANTDEPN